MLEHFLPFEKRNPLFSIYINRKERKYKEFPTNMFKILEGADLMESLSNDALNYIDPTENIIIVSKNENVLKRNPEGSMSFLTNTKIDISNSRNINNHLAAIDYVPRVKMIIPKGIYMDLRSPDDSGYHYKLYTEYNKTPRMDSDENVPGHIVYDNLRITIYFDMQRVRRKLTTLHLKVGTPLFNILFYPIYHVGNHDFTILDKIYWVKNEEVFKNLKEIY